MIRQSDQVNRNRRRPQVKMNQMEAGSGDRSSSGALPRLLESLTNSVSQRPGATLWIVGLLTLLCVAITGRFLEFKTNRADLIDPNTEFHQRWLNYTEQFGDEADVVIVVQGADELTIKNVMDGLGQQLETEPELFTRVLYRIVPGAVQSKALQYLSPQDLEQANERLAMYAPILEGHWSRAGLESYAIRLNDYLQHTVRSGTPTELTSAFQQASLLCVSLQQFAEDSKRFVSPWPEIVKSGAVGAGNAFETRYQVTSSGNMGFVVATPRNTATDFSGGAKSIARMREICADFQAENQGVQIGMTGIPVLEADEMQRSQQDMIKASFISFLGVGMILLIGFRGFRHPFLALITLAVGLAWALGYTTLVVGHLNILSVSFAAILIGLGIDFAIHYLARYLELRHQQTEFQLSLSRTAQTVGTGIVTAAVTTAIAFLCATFTNFLGVAELGIIAGGGILLCGAATFTVLPALLTIADRNKETRQLPTPFQGNFLRSLTREKPGLVACSTLLAILAIGAQGLNYDAGTISSKVRYDSNLLNLQAKGVESVELQKEIFQEANGSLLYAVSIADSIAEVRILKEEFLQLPTVARVEEMASYLPAYPPAETNLLLQAIHARLSRLSDLPREFPVLDPLSIGQSMDRLYETLASREEPEAINAAAALNLFLEHLTTSELPQQMEVLANYQGGMLTALHRQFQALEQMSNPDPVTPHDFAPGIHERFVADSGAWLLRVYPNQQIWEEEPLAAFVADVRSVDPEVTGTPLQNFEAALQIRESYFDAAIYALLMITLILLMDALNSGALLVSVMTPVAVIAFAYTLQQRSGGAPNPMHYACLYMAVVVLVSFVFDFVSVRNTFLTLLPPLAGGFMMFGILGILGIDLNPANLIVLPLILGIGVDDGVHVIHDYHHASGPYETSPSTINAITLTSLTSMVGFGSMMVAAHQGLVSLGVVLVVGVGSCLFVSLVTLPAILTLINRWGQTEQTPPQASSAGQFADVVVSIPMKAHEPGVA